MTNPVILLGTQSNGETLPVQVDATGRLVAEGLQGQPGDPGSQGEKGDKGDPGPKGADGADGAGVPSPYGGEGSYLWIKDGAPAWTTGEDPGPGPEPEPDVIFNGLPGRGNGIELFDSSGNLTNPPDETPDSWARKQSNWWDPNQTKEGIIFNNGGNDFNSGSQSNNFEMEMSNSFGKVLEIMFTANIEYITTSAWQGNLVIEQTDQYIVPIRSEVPFEKINYETSYLNTTVTMGFLLNREVTSYAPKFVFNWSFAGLKWSIFNGWRLVDPGLYAVEQQMRAQKEIEDLRRALSKVGSTTDIDL